MGGAVKSRLIWPLIMVLFLASAPPVALSRAAENASDQSAAVSANADALLDRAEALRASGDIDGAMRMVANVLRFAPQEPRAMGAYGKLLLAKGQEHEAIVYLDWAIRLAPDDWDLLTARGVAHDRAGDTEAARSDLKRALAMKPGDPAILYDLALAQIRTGDLDEAKVLLREAQSKAGADPRIAAKLAAIEKLQQENAAPVAGQSLGNGSKALSGRAQDKLGSSPKLTILAPPTVPAASPHAPLRSRAAAPAKPKDASLRASVTEDAEFYLQVGAFAVPANAERLKTKLARFGAHVLEPKGMRALYFVRTGPYPGLIEARAVRKEIEALGMRDIQIVTE